MSTQENFCRRGSRPQRLAVIGAGNVGSTFAYTALLRGQVSEIVLIDIDKKRAEGQAMDLVHAAPLSNPVRIWAGDYDDCADAAVIMIAAGASQKPGQSRLDLLQTNAGIFSTIIPKAIERNDQAILLIATNPVDIMSYVAWKVSGLPASRVIGSGTVLDTARFRSLLGGALDLDPRNIHAYIIGEHGDSEVAVWSRTTVAGIPVDDFCRNAGCRLPETAREDIFRQAREAAYEIIDKKGSTYYAVAAALSRILASILQDQRSLLPVSTLVPAHYGLGEIYLSLPSLLGHDGVLRVLEMPLSDAEEKALVESAKVLQEAIRQLHL